MKNNLKSRLFALALPLAIAGCSTAPHTTLEPFTVTGKKSDLQSILPTGNQEVSNYTVGDKKIIVSYYTGGDKQQSLTLDVYPKDGDRDYNSPKVRFEDVGMDGTVDEVTIYENSDVFRTYTFNATRPSTSDVNLAADPVIMREAQKKFDTYTSAMKNQVQEQRASQTKADLSRL